MGIKVDVTLHMELPDAYTDGDEVASVQFMDYLRDQYPSTWGAVCDLMDTAASHTVGTIVITIADRPYMAPFWRA